MNGHNRLVRRNHTYYIRARIPSSLVYLANSTQFWYSLKTNDYYEALAKLPKESHKVNVKINLLREIDMRIRKGQLILDDEDIDKMVKFKLQEVEYIIENREEDIASHKLTPENYTTLSNPENIKKFPDAQKNQYEIECVELFIKEYFNDLKDNRYGTTHRSVVKQIGRIEKEQIPIITNKAAPEEPIMKTLAAIKGLDKYIKDKFDSIEQDVVFNKRINDRVKRCLTALENEKNDRSNTPTTSSPWFKVFAEFAADKRNDRVSENSINKDEKCLETIFAMIGKTTVESITSQDCRNVSRAIYNLPKKWKERYKGKKLSDILAQQNEDHISLTTIKKYLRVFREFMTFCKNNGYNVGDLYNDIRISKVKEAVEREEFSKDELKLIFNVKTYPRKIDIQHPYRFWIPLIALFSGMRLNEICQLYLDDIKCERKVWYFKLTDERKDQHIKNKASKRNVPIHPTLIELGLLDYIKRVKELKKDRLFYQFSYSEKNHYANTMSGWFARYLKQLGIKKNTNAFHSFRHTVKQHLRDSGISIEYQHKLCGWVGGNIGEDVYGRHVSVKKLSNELEKLKYPFLNRNIEAIKKRNK